MKKDYLAEADAARAAVAKGRWERHRASVNHVLVASMASGDTKFIGDRVPSQESMYRMDAAYRAFKKKQAEDAERKRLQEERDIYESKRLRVRVGDLKVLWGAR